MQKKKGGPVFYKALQSYIVVVNSNSNNSNTIKNVMLLGLINHLQP